MASRQPSRGLAFYVDRRGAGEFTSAEQRRGEGQAHLQSEQRWPTPNSGGRWPHTDQEVGWSPMAGTNRQGPTRERSWSPERRGPPPSRSSGARRGQRGQQQRSRSRGGSADSWGTRSRSRSPERGRGRRARSWSSDSSSQWEASSRGSGGSRRSRSVSIDYGGGGGIRKKKDKTPPARSRSRSVSNDRGDSVSISEKKEQVFIVTLRNASEAMEVMSMGGAGSQKKKAKQRRSKERASRENSVSSNDSWATQSVDSRDGGGGGGGGGRACYNCGEVGHISRGCPQPSTGGSPSRGQVHARNPAIMSFPGPFLREVAWYRVCVAWCRCSLIPRSSSLRR